MDADINHWPTAVQALIRKDPPPRQPTPAHRQGTTIVNVAELARVDPVTAARLPPQDAQRIGRALEVWRHTARPLSSFFGGQAKPPPFKPWVISLEPQERGWLHERIALCGAQILAHHFAHELLETRKVSDANFKAMTAMFGERGAVDLTSVMGYYCMVSMILNIDEYPLPEGAKPELKTLR